MRVICMVPSASQSAAADLFIAGTGVLGDISVQIVDKSRDMINLIITFSAVPANRAMVDFLGCALVDTEN